MEPQGEARRLPDEFAFRLSWRPYQARVLEEIDEHLEDRHLHVVAAPGSGKTILGLEVVRHLGQPALILVPSLPIRNQWVDRITTHFMPPGSDSPDWISTDIRSPNLLTVSTYQALHAAARDGKTITDNGDDVDGPPVTIAALITAGVRTVVLDEAHHLRDEWWKHLTELKWHLPDPTIVALTATPPYDVSTHEWDRYIDLCGAIDAEIAVPELVREGNLCPHEDLVFLNLPAASEHRTIDAFRQQVSRVFAATREHPPFIDAIESHPYLENPHPHVAEILDKPAYFSSIAIFLCHAGRKKPKALLSVLGVDGRRVPAFDAEWLEVLLEGCLFHDTQSYDRHGPVINELKNRLREIGAIERRRVVLRTNKNVEKLMTWSVNKLHSIAEIVAIEGNSLCERLRLVILTDYIRKEDLPRSPDSLPAISKIGAVPIFEALRRLRPSGHIRLGILTGSLVIVPQTSTDLLRSAAAELGINMDRIAIKPLAHDPDYVTVTLRGSDQHGMVRLITLTFRRGGVTVLIGTASLLGEGWDAPSINALILASFVSSYMLSNQMRGRAIRTDPEDSRKTANIWHLATIEPGQASLSRDLRQLTRRFRAFLGVSFREQVIENGIARLDLGDPPFTAAETDGINQRMKQFAIDRDGLSERWRQVLEMGEKGIGLIEQVQAPRELANEQILIKKTIKAAALSGLLGIATVLGYSFEFFGEYLRFAGTFEVHRSFYLGIAVLAIILLWFGRDLFKALYLSSLSG